MRLAALFVIAVLAFAQNAPTLSVDVSAGRHAISPGVYGFNWDFQDETTTGQAAALDNRASVRRWGGNSTSRYHWKLDLMNSGADWFFMTSPDGKSPAQVASLPEGSSFNQTFERWTRSGAQVVGTIPILDWLIRARSNDKQCSFSVAKYGKQCMAEYWDTDCGNGYGFVNGCVGPTQEPWNYSVPGSAPKIQNDPSDIHAKYDELLQRDWVKYVVGKYGPANRGGVAYWSLDNEPDWWFTTHRDIHPAPQTYDETLERGLRYARAVKDADPSALVTGPVSSGWQSLFYSAADIQAGWNSGRDWYSNPTDRNAHGGMEFVPWYLQKFRDAEKAEGRRLLDVLDIHGYITPDNPTDAVRMTSTRMFWDPNYTYQNYWIVDTKTRGPIATRLIPMLREWIDQYYPGTKLAITEYDWGGYATMAGGIAQADILGIFGREGVDVATLWHTGDSPTAPAAFAFRLYRNYDGIGGAFGETGVQATTSDADRLSIYAAQRSDSMVTVVVLNKTAGDISTTVGLNGFAPGEAAKVWRYTGANKAAIVQAPDAQISGSGVSTMFPAYSMTMLVIPPAQFAGPKPVVKALQNAASYASDKIAPGELVVVWGDNLGPKDLAQAGADQYDPNGMYRYVLSDTRVLFDGVPGRPLWTSAGAIAVVVPYFGAVKATTHVQVEYKGVRSDPLEIPVAPTLPGMFTNNQQGSGNGAIYDENGNRNGPDHPVSPGHVAVLYLTGEGITDPPGIDGRPATDIVPKPVAPVEVQIGGTAAKVEYAGAVPTLIPGVMQVNARLDTAVQPNDKTPVKVKIGGNWSQDGVTMVVR